MAPAAAMHWQHHKMPPQASYQAHKPENPMCDNAAHGSMRTPCPPNVWAPETVHRGDAMACRSGGYVCTAGLVRRLSRLALFCRACAPCTTETPLFALPVAPCTGLPCAGTPRPMKKDWHCQSCCAPRWRTNHHRRKDYMLILVILVPCSEAPASKPALLST